MADEYQTIALSMSILGATQGPAQVSALSVTALVSVNLGVNPSFVPGSRQVFKPLYKPTLLPKFVSSRVAFPASMGVRVKPILATRLGGVAAFTPEYRPDYPISTTVEWNPYRANADESDPTYLDEQANIIRDQHNKAQAGDSTFDISVLTQTSADAAYTLGSLGRFVDPNYGIIIARYVQFTQMVDNVGAGSPVGRLKTDEGVSWKVTNDLSRSDPTLVLGVACVQKTPSEGEYGWAIVAGANALQLVAQTNVIPSQNDTYSWTSTGRLGLASPGPVVARRWGKSAEAFISPGSVFVTLESLSPKDLEATIDAQMAAGLSRVSALEVLTAQHTAELADHEARILTNTEDLASLTDRIAAEEDARAQADSQIRNLIGQSGSFDGSLASVVTTLRGEYLAGDEALSVRISANADSITRLNLLVNSLDQSGLTVTVGALADRVTNLENRDALRTDLSTAAVGDILVATDGGLNLLGEPVFVFKSRPMVIDDASDVDTATTPPTDGQALVWNAADSKFIPGDVASGGGGGSITVSIPDIFAEVMRIRSKAYTTNWTSGSKLDALVSRGDMRALILDIYASGSTGSGSPVTSTTATVTVPAGKVAFLLYYARSSQTLSDPTYYKHWVRNTTTNTDYNPNQATNNYHGFVVPEGANSTITYPYQVGVAGDTLVLRASSSGDGNSRTVAGFAIIVFADATTHDFDPGTSVTVSGGGGGGGGGSGTPWWLQPPLAANFSTTQAGGLATTISDDADVGLLFSLTTPGSASNVGARLKAIVNPTSDWVITTRMEASVAGSNSGTSGNIGLVCSNSARNSFIWWSWDSRQAMHAMKYGTSGYGGWEWLQFWYGDKPKWLRMRYVASSGVVYFDASADGKLWLEGLTSRNVNSDFGAAPSYYGFGLVPESYSLPLGGSFGYWAESN